MPSHFATLPELRAALDAGDVTPTQLVAESLARERARREALNAFARVRPEAARAEAAAAAERIARGAQRSPLDGIPVAIKDVMVHAGEVTACASRILEGFVSPYSATAVEKLEAAGAIIVGGTNMDEFAMGSSTEHSVYGPAHNPWQLACTAGGSSGGSAAAVAAGIVPAALGSDTGGSVRQPAAFCGVVGLKPTYGRVSRWGLVAFASSLDQIGIFAHTAADAACVLEIIAGHDAKDSTSLPEPVPAYREALTGDVSDLVIGLPVEYLVEDGVDPEVLAAVRGAVDELARAGAKVREVSLPHTEYAVATYYLIATAEASSNLARYDGVRYGHRAAGATSLTDMYFRTRSAGFGDEVKRRIILGTYVLSAGYYDAYYRKAQQVRTLLRRDFEQAFRGCDVIATPTTPEVAFRLGERTGDPLRMYLSDIYTVSANLAGIPGISVPCGFAQGLPIGLQLLAAPLEEATLLRVADAYQRRSSAHRAHPPEPA
ncbi:MAG: Asp-tRNA(Asn)/Glu-tRNA(Gln) amidotransferase subunit GatA [Myxococcales bacterium]|nr:Asp-tRNA(Asn)/Glu-tRNA(Gln) amidotransferase subunit GatA [Myxococcales bacterium]MDH5308001.1 Asp-tRNA(Asn)/Glu-tRNA(Gln) amidotransferase subunit GatA [Myxococcales bacterium]MDH5566684.1 Asp-tRNA(Asn)/Glu-tRNA(Gln) amidotransferase subunit GatA [Myxococcales bacterium]